LIITDKVVQLIQSKDSPNIEKIVNHKISRKVSASHKALRAAAGQIKGAITYMRRSADLVVLVNDRELKFDLSGKTIFGLAIIKELFDNEYHDYT
ncbi:hypothetical protein, partial [Pseudomonas viridiflava]|uniref:hypothetical protein n=1 Tax=Pseudomonas viridiflava TaxID=33069 RepID=UPI003C73BBEB